MFVLQLVWTYYFFDKSKKEFETQLGMPTTVAAFHALEIPITDAKALFSMIDVDGSGSITPDEFSHGLLMLKGEARAKDTIGLEGLVRYLDKKFFFFKQPKTFFFENV